MPFRDVIKTKTYSNFVYRVLFYTKRRLKKIRSIPEHTVLLLMPLWIHSKHAPVLMDWLRNRLQILFTAPQLIYIVKLIRSYQHCNLAVFGLGNDTPLWLHANKKGRNVFFEHNLSWCQHVQQKVGAIEAYIVDYPTRMSQWHELLERTDILQIPLPDAVSNTAWDVVIVDGPTGGNDPDPGRMCSIYTARQMVAKNGHILVDDCERKIEETYSDRFLQETNQVHSIFKRTLLKHYHFSD